MPTHPATASTATPASPPDASQFTALSGQLAAIVQRFKTETLPLDEALSLFEEGVHHVAQCQAILASTEGRLTELQTLLAEVGQPSAVASPGNNSAATEA